MFSSENCWRLGELWRREDQFDTISEESWGWIGEATFHHRPGTSQERLHYQEGNFLLSPIEPHAKSRSAVGNVSGNRCESDCRSRGREFDPGPVPCFRGDWSCNNFYGHSPPFRWIIQEGLLSVASESMCTKYWLTACSSLPRKKCG